MNRTLRLLSVASAALLLAGAAHAQPHGGGRGGPGAGPGGGPGMGPGGPGGPGGGIVVTADGTAVLSTRTSSTSGTTTTVTHGLKAVSAGGTIAWTFTAPGGIHDTALVGSLLVVALGPASPPASGSTPEPTTLVALNAATGAEAWRLTLDGVAGKLTAAGTRTLAAVGVHTAATSTTPASVSRSLVSIDATGHISWTLPLD